jgi:hypothetical protein
MAPLFDLLILVPLLGVLAFGIMRLGCGLTRSRPQAAGPAVFRLAGVGALVTVAVIIVAVLASQLGAADPVITSPSARQAAGAWTGAHGAMLILTADGRFTASALPAAGVGDWRIGSTPISGSGVWHVGVFDSGTPLGVIFDFANGSQAELQLEQDGSTLALFYDVGDPDEGWNGQYRFVR